MRADVWDLKMNDKISSILSKIGGVADKVAAKFVRTQGNIDKLGKGGKEALGQLSEFGKGGAGGIRDGLVESLGISPRLGGSIAKLAGPAGIAAAAVVGIGMAISKGVQAAEQYNIQFRQLRNLNLDKTKAELDAVNDRVLRLSFEKGLNADKMIAGVAEVQSTIGDFGPHVERMVARVGEASRALDMDYSAAVAGAAKALSQFNLPLSKVDDLMNSNAKTVNLGVVSFDELSKVQTVYAGAAASANQKVDTANKVFAMLTTNTKNASVAATMTAAAFGDMGKKATADTFKKIGVDVFAANGSMRQADVILRDLVPKFAEMSDKDFAALKEEIGGSEGLRGLLDMAKASGEKVLDVLNQFDQTKVGINDAIEKANADLDIMDDKINNKIHASWVRLGQAFLPGWVKFKSAASDALDWVVDGFEAKFNPIGFAVRKGAEEVDKRLSAGREIASEFFANYENLSADDRVARIEEVNQRAAKYEEQADAAAGTEAGKKLKALAIAMREMAGEFSDALTKQSDKQNLIDAKSGAYAGLFDDKKGKGGATKGVEAITGGGKQVRNVTVNIQSLVKELTVRTATVREGAQDIKKHVEEALIRAVQGSELAIAND